MDDSTDIIGQRADVAQEEFAAPIGKLLSLTLMRGGFGRATAESEAAERVANPIGTLHGGVLCNIADAPMAVSLN